MKADYTGLMKADYTGRAGCGLMKADYRLMKV
jgi:hypothetical protein